MLDFAFFDIIAVMEDVEIVGQPVSLADRNYPSWQKIFDKNYALFLEIIRQSLRTF